MFPYDRAASVTLLCDGDRTPVEVDEGIGRMGAGLRDTGAIAVTTGSTRAAATCTL